MPLHQCSGSCGLLGHRHDQQHKRKAYLLEVAARELRAGAGATVTTSPPPRVHHSRATRTPPRMRHRRAARAPRTGVRGRRQDATSAWLTSRHGSSPAGRDPRRRDGTPEKWTRNWGSLVVGPSDRLLSITRPQKTRRRFASPGQDSCCPHASIPCALNEVQYPHPGSGEENGARPLNPSLQSGRVRPIPARSLPVPLEGAAGQAARGKVP